MSGKIELKVRAGNHRERFSFKELGYYPEWFLEVTSENGEVVNFSPKITELVSLLRDIILYERLLKYDFYKKTQTVNGDVDDQIKDMIDCLIKIDIKEFREIICKKNIAYRELLYRKEELNGQHKLILY